MLSIITESTDIVTDLIKNIGIVIKSAQAKADFIQSINIILEYYVPGFCLVFVYRHFRNKNASSISENIQLGISIVLSYLLHVLWMTRQLSIIMAEFGVLYFVINKIKSARKYAKKRDLFFSCIFFIIFSIGTPFLFLASQNNGYSRVVYESVIAIILALDLVLLHKNKHVKAIYSWVNNTTLSETVFECSQMTPPCDVIVYGEGRRIEGRLLNYDLADDDAWLLLDIYKIFDDNGKLLGSWKYETEYHQLLVPLSEVKCIKVDASQGEKPSDYDDERKKENDLSKNVDNIVYHSET